MHAKANETTQGTLPPIELDTLVPCGPDAAFDYFTRDIARWWPLSMYSCSQARAVGVAFDGRVGGLLTETDVDGKRHVWGTILVWEPGKRVAFTWHPTKPPDDALKVEVTFLAAGEATRVRLVHSGWERLGAIGSEARQGYANGWPNVLGRLYRGYCEKAEASS